MKKIQSFVFCAVFVMVAMSTQTANAQLPAIDQNLMSDPEIVAKLALVQDLMKKIEELRKQVADNDFKLKEGLEKGDTDEDIKKVQELLATDPEIYPEGLTTGYFGVLTEGALERFQQRHAIKITGEIDAETRKLILGYFEESVDGKIPSDLLQIPNIDRKIKLRLTTEGENKLKINCNTRGTDTLTCKLKGKDSKESLAKQKALTAISRAEVAIDALESNITKAEEALAKAKAVLVKAEEAFNDDDYASAEASAESAEDSAVAGFGN